MSSFMGMRNAIKDLPLKWPLIFLTICLCLPCQAEVVTWQGYEIHHTSLNSMLIPAKVAAAHGIVRSRSRLITNITIRKNNQAVSAEMTGTARNLLGQLFSLDFTEVVEPGAIYYLASQVVDDQDRLAFKIEIIPKGSLETFPLNFTREYH